MTNMHANSIEAFRGSYFGERAQAVLDAFIAAPVPLTDAECATRMGFPHKSKVQPRISELIIAGFLREVASAKDPETGKTVRCCMATSLARKASAP